MPITSILSSVLLVLLPLLALAKDPPKTPRTFAAAEKLLFGAVYADHRIDIYCGCSYDEHLLIDVSTCGIARRRNATRAVRIEAEHIVPAQWLGEGRTCWREPENFPECTTRKGKRLSGRECCLRVDPEFRAAHNDLHNLAPAAGELNGDRSDRRYGMIDGEPRAYGNCDFEVDFQTDRAEPPPSARGLVARVSLYMAETYGLTLSDQQRALFEAWDWMYPADAWERERDTRIKKSERVGNRLVEGQKR